MQCARVIEDAERYAGEHGGWTTKRHIAYPTTDLPVNDVPELKQWLMPIVHERLNPLVASCYGLDPSTIGFRDLFIARYASKGQRLLRPHRDGSTISFNVLLNDAADFDGGGTYVHGLGYSVQVRRGHALIHGSKLMHEGFPITRGMRYILVGFVTLTEGVLNTSFVEDQRYLTPPSDYTDRFMMSQTFPAHVRDQTWEAVGEAWRAIAERQFREAIASGELEARLRAAEAHALQYMPEPNKAPQASPRKWDGSPAYYLEHLHRWGAALLFEENNVTLSDVHEMHGDDFLALGLTPEFGAALKEAIRAGPPTNGSQVPQPADFIIGVGDVGGASDADPPDDAAGAVAVVDAAEPPPPSAPRAAQQPQGTAIFGLAQLLMSSGALTTAPPRKYPSVRVLRPSPGTWVDVQRDNATLLVAAFLKDDVPSDAPVSGDVQVCFRLGSPLLLDLLREPATQCSGTIAAGPGAFDITLPLRVSGEWAAGAPLRVEAVLVDAGTQARLNCDVCSVTLDLRVKDTLHMPALPE